MIGSSGYQSPDAVRSGALWESTSPRRFEYQSAKPVNEHRFKIVNLPEIYSKNKREPCFDYDKSFGRNERLSKEPNRSYKVNYDLVQRKPNFVSFTKRQHKDLMKLTVEEEKKEKLWDRLLKRAVEEKEAEERKF